MNQLLTAGCVPPSVPGHALHEKGLQRQKRRRSTGQQPRTKSAPRPADKPRFNRSFRSFIGLHRISLVCSSGETFRRRLFDALESAGEDCPLGEQFCWRTVLPDPAPPPRRAPRRDPPVVCPGFGLDRLIYIGIRLFVLVGGRSGDVSSMLWRVRGRIFP